MYIPKETADTLKRYFLNANPFLWGVLEARKKGGKILEIQKMGFLMNLSEKTKDKYDTINQALLVELGIEGIMTGIVVPLVYKRIGAENLKRFRRYWEQGQKPDTKYLKDNKIYQVHRIGITRREENREVPEKDPAYIFLDINQQLNFVDQWTAFAGLWFEIIDPLLTKEEREANETLWKTP
jgi:hypothetical protein